MTKRPQKTFSQELKELRARKGKSVHEVSIITSVPVRSLFEYEAGDSTPNPFKRAGILDRLGRSK